VLALPFSGKTYLLHWRAPGRLTAISHHLTSGEI
jgi:hypothetical protein